MNRVKIASELLRLAKELVSVDKKVLDFVADYLVNQADEDSKADMVKYLSKNGVSSEAAKSIAEGWLKLPANRVLMNTKDLHKRIEGWMK